MGDDGRKPPLPDDTTPQPKPSSSETTEELRADEKMESPKPIVSRHQVEKASPGKFALPPIKHQSSRKKSKGDSAATQDTTPPKVWKPTPTHATSSPKHPSVEPTHSSPIQPFKSMAGKQQVGPPASPSSSFSPYQPPPLPTKPPPKPVTAGVAVSNTQPSHKKNDAYSTPPKDPMTEPETKEAATVTATPKEPSTKDLVQGKIPTKDSVTKPSEAPTAKSTTTAAPEEAKNHALDKKPQSSTKPFTFEAPATKPTVTKTAATPTTAAKEPIVRRPALDKAPASSLSTPPSSTPRKKRVAAKSVLAGKVPDGFRSEMELHIAKKQKTVHDKEKQKHQSNSFTKKKRAKQVARKSTGGSALESIGKPQKASPAKRTKKEIKSPPPSSGKKKKSLKSPSSSSPTRPKALEVGCGKPTETLENGKPFPPGWKRRIFQRSSGATKGTTDKYWYSPVTDKKFRSIKEVSRFLALLGTHKGNEQEAWNAMKNRKK